MADQLSYTGAINIRDVDDFTAETDITAVTAFWVRVAGGNKKMTGQVVASEAIAEGNIGALTELTSGGLDSAADKILIRDESAGVNKYILPSALSSTTAHDSLTSGAVTAKVARVGGSTTTISNPASGEYTLTVQSGAHLLNATIFGTPSTLNGSSEMLIRINNTANSRDRRVNVQLYDADNDALVDQFATGTNHTQSVSGNITLLTIPGLNGFSSSGFYIEIS